MSALTMGVHHIGLTVGNLSHSVKFFTDLLGWEQVGENPEYPAVFVSDGSMMITLWQQRSGDEQRLFDKNFNVGLHHLALRVVDQAMLHRVYQKIVSADNVTVEFGPELLRNGPAMHMMCYEPSGVRIEIIAA